MRKLPPSWWNRTPADASIMSRQLHDALTAFMVKDQIKLITALQDLKVYADKLQQELFEEPQQ